MLHIRERTLLSIFFEVVSVQKDQGIYFSSFCLALFTFFGSFMKHLEFREKDRLVGCSVLEILPTQMTSQYFFWNKAYSSRSLGTFSALYEINLCKELKIEFWSGDGYVHSCPRMNYKSHYKPMEIMCLQRKWHLFDSDVSKCLDENKHFCDCAEEEEEDLKALLKLPSFRIRGNIFSYDEVPNKNVFTTVVENSLRALGSEFLGSNTLIEIPWNEEEKEEEEKEKEQQEKEKRDPESYLFKVPKDIWILILKKIPLDFSRDHTRMSVLLSCKRLSFLALAYVWTNYDDRLLFACEKNLASYFKFWTGKPL